MSKKLTERDLRIRTISDYLEGYVIDAHKKSLRPKDPFAVYLNLIEVEIILEALKSDYFGGTGGVTKF